MTPEEIKRHYGSTYRFQKETGMGSATLHLWLKKGYVPISSQARLQLISNGALKADPEKPKERLLTKELLQELKELRAYKAQHEALSQDKDKK